MCTETQPLRDSSAAQSSSTTQVQYNAGAAIALDGGARYEYIGTSHGTLCDSIIRYWYNSRAHRSVPVIY